MLHINDTTKEIQLTRGDTAYLQVPLISVDSSGVPVEYVMAAGDTLTFTVKTSEKSSTICFQKVSVGSNEFKILPTDTHDREFGKYKYDVQLTKANGDVHTVIEPACFRITAEVTY